MTFTLLGIIIHFYIVMNVINIIILYICTIITYFISVCIHLTQIFSKIMIPVTLSNVRYHIIN